MRGSADNLATGIGVFLILCAGYVIADRINVDESAMTGDILDVLAEKDIIGEMEFSVVLDLDDGNVVICHVPSAKLGGTLYRLYRNRKPDLPRLRETARVQVGRRSGSVVCRGLAMANAEQQTGDQTMTWNEFKESVDKQLVELGADGSIQIEYIDIGHTSSVEVSVSKEDDDDDGLMSVD